MAFSILWSHLHRTSVAYSVHVVGFSHHINKPTTRLTSDANNFVNAKSHARKKPLLAGYMQSEKSQIKSQLRKSLLPLYILQMARSSCYVTWTLNHIPMVVQGVLGKCLACTSVKSLGHLCKQSSASVQQNRTLSHFTLPNALCNRH